MPLARPLPAAAPRPATPLLIALEVGAGVENLEDILEEVGGFSTKDVSVVLRLDQHAIHLEHALDGKPYRKVASTSFSGPVLGLLVPRMEAGSKWARLKDSEIGACDTMSEYTVVIRRIQCLPPKSQRRMRSYLTHRGKLQSFLRTATNSHA